jgi:predicted acetyltransferase
MGDAPQPLRRDGFELGPIAPEEFDALARLAGTVYYGAPPSGEEIAWMARLVDLQRSVAVHDKDQLVATAATAHFELTVPGGDQVPAAGLTEVAVLPTHRRRGLGRWIVTHHLADARNRGELVSVLMATEGAIYGRLGYGVGTMRADWHLPRAGAALRRATPQAGHPRIVPPEEAAKLLPVMFEAHRRVQHGQLDRSRTWWEAYFAQPAVVYKGGPGQLQHVVYETDAGAEGYAAYRFQAEWDVSVANHVVTIVELVTLSDAAADGLLRFLAAIDLSTRMVLLGRTVDDPVRWQLTDPRRLRPRDIRDFLWVRLLDVPAALGVRRYGTDGVLVLEVVDDADFPHGGRFRLEGSPAGAACVPTQAAADLTIEIGDLASCYLGAVGFANLTRAGRVDEHTSGALARAELMFRTPVDPWCSTQF